MLADLLLENGEAVEALREYKVVLKIAPRRFNGHPGSARAAEKSGKAANARAYSRQLLEIAEDVDTSRPAVKLADVDGNASPCSTQTSAGTTCRNQTRWWTMWVWRQRQNGRGSISMSVILSRLRPLANRPVVG
jgi:hypothetical protein